MGCLVFGVYLSVTFLIGSASPALKSTSLSAIYTLGFLLYSLVPVSRMLTATGAVDAVVRHADETRVKLYYMEAAAADDRKLQSDIRYVGSLATCKLKNITYVL